MREHMAVELEHDPSRKGTIVRGPRPRRLDGAEYDMWRVRWEDNQTNWHPEYELRPAPETAFDHFDLLRAGRFAGHSELRRNITFCQVAGNVGNLVYSMDAANIEFHAYQYKPVLTFLESPSNGLLIADEVGLGKTIEAGLIWTELRARSDVRRLLVVCPALLRDKWELELENRFGVSSRQLDATALLKELSKPRHRASDSEAAICSIQGLRPPRDYDNPAVVSPSARLARFLEEQSSGRPVIDLLVIDEAHYLRNRNTRNAALGKLLRKVSENVVLLSATPVNNKNDDLFQQLQMVDPDTFYSPEVLADVLKANEPLIDARRLILDRRSRRDDILKLFRRASQHHLLRNNKRLRSITASMEGNAPVTRDKRIDLAHAIDQTNLLRHVVSRTRKREVQELQVVRVPRCYRVAMRPEGNERDFYNRVTDAIRRYAQEKDVEAGFLLCMPQHQMSSCMYAAAKSWSGEISGDELSHLAYGTHGHDADGMQRKFRPLVRYIANDLRDFNYQSLKDVDSKFEAFCDQVLQPYLKRSPKEKIIVFSFFKTTLGYLHDRLKAIGVSSQLLHGDVAGSKQHAIDKFRTSTDTHILLTSEVASEGVDLQFSSCIVNYDLPWNPMRIEQRIGRIDRIGQRARRVAIVSMVYEDTIDERIYTVLLEKIGIFERAIGGLENILGDNVRELAGDLLRRNLTKKEEEEQIRQKAIVIENRRRQEDKLEREAAHLVAFEGHVLNQINKARDSKRQITGYDLKSYVRDYLDRHGGSGFIFREHPSKALHVEIALPPALRARLEQHIRHERLRSTSLTDGRARSYEFSHKVAGSSHDRPINQFHPLIHFIGEQLKASSDEFCPLVALRLRPDDETVWPAGDYAFALRLWRFEGARLIHELQARAVVLDDGRLLSAELAWELMVLGKEQGMEWDSAALDIDGDLASDAIDRCEAQLQEDYNQTVQERKNDNDDRVDLQLESLKVRADRQLARQRDVLAIHREHGTNLVAATKGTMRKIKEQLAMDVERRELKRDFKARWEPMCAGVVRVEAKMDVS